MSLAIETSAAPAASVRAASPTLSPTLARGVVIAAILIAGVAGLLATDAATAARAAAQAGEGLTRLLRAMAMIKLGMAVAVAGAVLWRLSLPVGPARLAAYALACAAMAAGPGLIWDMARPVAGAGLLHAGLIAAALLLWRDPAVGARIKAMIKARRARVSG